MFWFGKSRGANTGISVMVRSMKERDGSPVNIRLRLIQGWTLPLLAGIVILIGAIGFWWQLSIEEREQIQERTAAEGERIAGHIEHEVNERFWALDRMAERWQLNGRPTQRQWEQSALLNVTDFEGFRSIQWIDANYQVRWVVPHDFYVDPGGMDLALSQERRNALERARSTASPAASAPVELPQGDMGIVAYQPVFKDRDLSLPHGVLEDNFDGFIIGILSVEHLFSAVLPEQVVQGYSVALLHEDNEYVRLATDGRDTEQEWNSLHSFSSLGQTWQVRVWPDDGTLALQRSALPMVALIGGSVLAMLSALLVRLYQSARQRTHEVQAANREIASFARALEQSNSQLEEFAYVASHDLKAPLVSLRGMTEILAEDFRDDLPAEAHLYLDRITVNANRMQRLLDDLLQMSRLRQTDAPFVAVDLNAVVDSVTDQLSQMLEERGASIEVLNPLPVINGNEMWMTQVFTNLIDNGVQYTPADRAPMIRIWSHVQTGTCQIFVGDNGEGIPAEYRDRVFGMFQRLPGGKALNPGGSGMGLAIVTRAVDLHRGNIWIESTGAEGTTFAFTIPDILKAEGVRRDMSVSVGARTLA